MRPIKITFTDHFLNTFDGTQQELDSIVDELKQKFAAGEFEEFFQDPDQGLTIGTDEEDLFEYEPRILH